MPAPLKNAACAGLYHLPAADQPQFRKRAEHARLRVLQADLGRHAELDGILGELGKALDFPDWYGANLDALHDCLADPDWRGHHGVALLIDGLDTLRRKSPPAFLSLLEVFASATGEASTEKQPLWIVLDIPAPGIAELPAT